MPEKAEVLLLPSVAVPVILSPGFRLPARVKDPLMFPDASDVR